MKTGINGIKLIKQFEGLPKPNKEGLYPPYICPAGYPTIGYGSRYHANGSEVKLSDAPITKAQADVLLIQSLKRYEASVSKMVKVQLTQNQFDALVDFVYNLGEGNLQISTLLRRLNAGFYDEAADQFLRWNKSRVNGAMIELPGLTARRTANRTLFLQK